MQSNGPDAPPGARVKDDGRWDSMFEVGRYYRITTGVGEDVGHGIFRVLEVDLPLIKVQGDVGTETIINTHASSFHSAEIHDREHDAAELNRRKPTDS
jgi:hypothetical protein